MNGRHRTAKWTAAALAAASAIAIAIAYGARAPRPTGTAEQATAADDAGPGGSQLAPLPRTVALSTHGPFAAEACGTCHERSDPRNPGRPTEHGNAACFGCHDDFQGAEPVRLGSVAHPSGSGTTCTDCHNPHNSRKKKLLL